MREPLQSLQLAILYFFAFLRGVVHRSMHTVDRAKCHIMTTSSIDCCDPDRTRKPIMRFPLGMRVKAALLRMDDPEHMRDAQTGTVSHLTAEIADKCVEMRAGVLSLVLLKGPIDSDLLPIQHSAIEALQGKISASVIREGHKAIACAHACDPVFDHLDLHNRAQCCEDLLHATHLAGHAGMRVTFMSMICFLPEHSCTCDTLDKEIVSLELEERRALQRLGDSAAADGAAGRDEYLEHLLVDVGVQVANVERLAVRRVEGNPSHAKRPQSYRLSRCLLLSIR